jgi:hypothetical protein
MLSIQVIPLKLQTMEPYKVVVVMAVQVELLSVQVVDIAEDLAEMQFMLISQPQ